MQHSVIFFALIHASNAEYLFSFMIRER
jgi:hypothetical protein